VARSLDTPRAVIPGAAVGRRRPHHGADSRCTAWPPALGFYRDRKGVEVDLIVELGRSLLAVETKSSRTVVSEFFAGLRAFAEAVGLRSPSRTVRRFVVYGGAELQRRSGVTVVPWTRVDSQRWHDPAE